ncbi:RhuM family protein [Nitratireductor sp.]|uniref:RhuM family protein n=1 Tax=Nitratireductor sp. TaxID=1872084 RepID=UPI0025DA5E34|nr:RhuM family protein [Nitratireductor sp.]
MGLQSWPGDTIRKRDVTVSKNYLAEAEIRELNRLTTILLDIFEDQADLGRLVVMEDATRLLDQQLEGLGRPSCAQAAV